MIKAIGKMTLAGLLAAIVLGVPVGVSAQDTNTAPAAVSAKKAKKSSTTFNGKLASIDKVAKTITLDDKTKRTFQVTSETRIMKGTKDSRKPATLDEGTLGENVSGSWTNAPDGKKALKTLYFNGAAVPKAKKKSKKNATVVPPDTNAVPATVTPPLK